MYISSNRVRQAEGKLTLGNLYNFIVHLKAKHPDNPMAVVAARRLEKAVSCPLWSSDRLDTLEIKDIPGVTTSKLELSSQFMDSLPEDVRSNCQSLRKTAEIMQNPAFFTGVNFACATPFEHLPHPLAPHPRTPHPLARHTSRTRPPLCGREGKVR